MKRAPDLALTATKQLSDMHKLQTKVLEAYKNSGEFNQGAFEFAALNGGQRMDWNLR